MYTMHMNYLMRHEYVIYLSLLFSFTQQPYAEGEEGQDFGPLKVPYPPLKEELEAKTHKNQQEKKKEEKKKQPNEPEYSIVHRGEMSMQDFTNDRTSSRIKRPKELVVTVHLPGVDSAKSVELDIFEKSLLLQCTKPLYKLDVSLLQLVRCSTVDTTASIVPRSSQERPGYEAD